MLIYNQLIGWLYPLSGTWMVCAAPKQLRCKHTLKLQVQHPPAWEPKCRPGNLLSFLKINTPLLSFEVINFFLSQTFRKKQWLDTVKVLWQSPVFRHAHWCLKHIVNSSRFCCKWQRTSADFTQSSSRGSASFRMEALGEQGGQQQRGFI